MVFVPILWTSISLLHCVYGPGNWRLDENRNRKFFATQIFYFLRNCEGNTNFAFRVMRIFTKLLHDYLPPPHSTPKLSCNSCSYCPKGPFRKWFLCSPPPPPLPPSPSTPLFLPAKDGMSLYSTSSLLFSSSSFVYNNGSRILNRR